MSRSIRSLLLLTIMVLSLTGSLNAQADKFAKFKEAFLRELTQDGIVGSSFVFIRDGKTVAEFHHGSANLEKRQPVNADTIYHWASNTKPFTGIAIMQLRDRNLLKLDD